MPRSRVPGGTGSNHGLSERPSRGTRKSGDGLGWRLQRAKAKVKGSGLSVGLSRCQFEALRGVNLRDFRNVHMGKKRVILAKNGLSEHFVGDLDQFGTVFVVIFTQTT